MTARKYVLLDRDGTIMVDKHYQKDPSLTELFPNALAGLKEMRASGFGLVLVTNQSGIRRGYLTADDLKAVNASLEAILAKEGIGFDGTYFCPHLPEDACSCRKPEPGMVLQAMRDLSFTPEDAVVVGDRDCDVLLGKAAGCKTVLVRTGGGKETEAAGDNRPDYVADDLLDAARWIGANV